MEALAGGAEEHLAQLDSVALPKDLLETPEDPAKRPV
jgi:hypothetical protein